MLLEPLPALLACCRRLAALAPAEGEAGGGAAGAMGLMDGSDATWLSGMGSQLAAPRAEHGCESSQALQVCVPAAAACQVRCSAAAPLLL